MTTAKKAYSLQIPPAVQKEMAHYRVTIREAIHKRLESIAEEAARADAGKKPIRTPGPPLRFYVHEGCRISYEVNPVTREIIVLKLQAENG